MVWFYAPGYTDGTRNRDEFVRETTGLDLRRVEIPGKATIETTPALGERLEYSLTDAAVSPLFAVHDDDATVLGRFAGTGQVAIASKRFADHTAWYAALPAWSSEIFRRLIAQTAAHRYSEEGDVVYAGGGLVTLHTKVGGRRTVVLRDGRRVAARPSGGARPPSSWTPTRAGRCAAAVRRETALSFRMRRPRRRVRNPQSQRRRDCGFLVARQD